MLQNNRKTLGFKKIMVYKIPPAGVCVCGGGNHNWPLAYDVIFFKISIIAHLIIRCFKLIV